MASPDCVFVHAADLHLDSPFVGLSDRLGGAFGELAKRASIQAMNRVFDLAEEAKADFLVIAGDLYDGAKVGVRAKVAFLNRVKEAGRSGLRVFVALGNHDPVDESWYARGELPENLHIFSAGTPETVTITLASGQLVDVTGVSYRQRKETENLALRFPRADPGRISVAVLHANVGGNPDHDSYSPAALEDLTKLGYDYFALGHIHSRALLSRVPMVAYSGTLQGRSMKPSELGAKGAMVVRASGKGTLSEEFVELASVRFERVEVEVPQEGETAVVEAARERLFMLHREMGDLEGLVVRVTLVGTASTIDPRAEALEGIAEALRDVLGSLSRPSVFVESVRSRIEARFDIAKVAERPDVVGLLARTFLEAPPLEANLVELVGQYREANLGHAAFQVLQEISASGLIGEAELVEVAEQARRLAIGPLVVEEDGGSL